MMIQGHLMIARKGIDADHCDYSISFTSSNDAPERFRGPDKSWAAIGTDAKERLTNFLPRCQVSSAEIQNIFRSLQNDMAVDLPVTLDLDAFINISI